MDLGPWISLPRWVGPVRGVLQEEPGLTAPVLVLPVSAVGDPVTSSHQVDALKGRATPVLSGTVEVDWGEGRTRVSRTGRLRQCTTLTTIPRPPGHERGRFPSAQFLSQIPAGGAAIPQSVSVCGLEPQVWGSRLRESAWLWADWLSQLSRGFRVRTPRPPGPPPVISDPGREETGPGTPQRSQGPVI